jgi:hypothetical protein
MKNSWCREVFKGMVDGVDFGHCVKIVLKTFLSLDGSAA